MLLWGGAAFLFYSGVRKIFLTWARDRNLIFYSCFQIPNAGSYFFDVGKG